MPDVNTSIPNVSVTPRFTWEFEQELCRVGKLKLPEGTKWLPAWQQVTFDCTAVSVAAAIQKLLVKEAYLCNPNRLIKAPHPAWLYAVARNQVLQGNRYLSPGCGLLDVVRAIKEYGILWLDERVPPYNLKTVDAWADAIHYRRAGVPHVDYLKECGQYVEKWDELRCVKVKSLQDAVDILEYGTVVIESSMSFSPMDSVSDRKILLQDNQRWGKHTTYLTDTEHVNAARWQIWGDAGVRGEYLNKGNEPSGFGWMSCDLLGRELQRGDTIAVGFYVEH